MCKFPNTIYFQAAVASNRFDQIFNDLRALARTVTLTLVNNESGDPVASTAAALDAKKAFKEIAKLANALALDIGNTVIAQVNKPHPANKDPTDNLIALATSKGRILAKVGTAVDADASASRTTYDKDIVNLVSDGLAQ